MKILVTGSGGREHALAWKALNSDGVEKVYVAPGNAGTAIEDGIENVDIDVMDFDAQIKFARDNDIHLTIVGPEAPLVGGVVDAFQEEGLRIFGPAGKAAQLEGSKQFTKDFLARHGIPTAKYQGFTDAETARSWIKDQTFPLVLKADGLAAGKGVVIAENYLEACNTLDDMLGGNMFGKAGSRVVIEEFLQGEEASFIVISDGTHVIPFASSQDHKAVYDGDKGPNTGGMGAYSPAPVITGDMHRKIMEEVILPTIKGMADEGNKYTGFLYAGLMITPEGIPKVIEFNCRHGDPETQPIMFRLKSDLVRLCNAAIDERLDQETIEFDERVALCVVMAAGGYPGDYKKGEEINGLDQICGDDCKVFHAGTRLDRERILTNGGRVLGVTAMGSDVSDAQRKAYELVRKISWNKVYYRTDIGYRAIGRKA
ncbi:MAG: phosphoribosylamine--glycine ligase [Gammaproteobacteria bacterium]|nr:phosphoribosylamine--glycine ligase [Gammaproteobacteria bacterium]